MPDDPAWAASWETEDNYWTENFSSRPYALGPDYYDRFRPAYRYGFESGRQSLGRTWEDANRTCGRVGTATSTGVSSPPRGRRSRRRSGTPGTV